MALFNIGVIDFDNLSNGDCFAIFNRYPEVKYHLNDISQPILLFVNEAILMADQIPGAQYRVGFLLEPEEIKPQVYYAIKQRLPDSINILLTHNSELLNKQKRAKLLPILGGSYILPEDSKIHPKDKDISIVASEKRFTSGHKLRHKIIERFSGIIQAYGPDYINLYKDTRNEDRSTLRGLYNYTTGNLARAFIPYRFSIAVENQIDDDYFTEKIINCFATGTIPIYYGARRIQNYFNPDGIIKFNSIEELDSILSTIVQDPISYYNTRTQAIVDNYNMHIKYQSFDKVICQTIQKS